MGNEKKEGRKEYKMKKIGYSMAATKQA